MTSQQPEPRFMVVLNDEEQYSIWPAGSDPPAGWYGAAVSGTREECLDQIERLWTDMRPKSLRKAMDQSGASTS
jgi:MbtH protein